MNDISEELLASLYSAIDAYPDFPTEGILFRDVSPLFRDVSLLREAISILEKRYNIDEIDIVVGIEARGFPIASLLAQSVNRPMVMARKSGKLPGTVKRKTYGFEYGSDAIEIQISAIAQGQRVLIIDDLLATGGTARATAELVKDLGGEVVGLAFLVELAGLNGRDMLNQDAQIESLITLAAYDK